MSDQENKAAEVEADNEGIENEIDNLEEEIKAMNELENQEDEEEMPSSQSRRQHQIPE